MRSFQARTFIKRRTGIGRERSTSYRYRYRNGVPLRDGEDALWVNWMELTIMDTDGTVARPFSFVTDLTLTKANIVNMIAAGRSRWKIENEHNNFDRRYQLLRKTLGRRKTFFQDVQALTKYFFYDSWSHLLIAMINGLELEDPGG
ncbi:MAG: hypothetical protein ACLFUX_00390 [Spirochaetaceae bacterium]